MPLRLFLTGPHANRSPLSYPALAPLWEGQIEQVNDPARADAYVFAHVLDIQTAPRAVIADWRARKRPVILLSEEPFWDTIWGRQPLKLHLYVDTDHGALPVHQLNHCTTDIYRFERIPYYLLTNPRFVRAYTNRFARGAAMSVDDWQARLKAASVDVGFMFERRPETHHNVSWPKGDLTGLCAWRTELAEGCTGPGVERWGRSWTGEASRFVLAGDWHQDKLSRLDGQCRILGAIENTHHPYYVTEKFFDALACGAVPLYWASPSHRIHNFGLPAEAWINLFGLTPEAAAETVMARRTGRGAALALQDASHQLHTRFGDETILNQERARLRTHVLQALKSLL